MSREDSDGAGTRPDLVLAGYPLTTQPASEGRPTSPLAVQADGRDGRTLTGVATSARPKRSAASRSLMTSELLDRATEIFAVKGYESTSLQDIADAVGVSRSALYHYVSSKEELLGMLVEQVSAGLAEVLEELSAREDLSARDKLINVVALLVRQRAEHPDQFRILDRAEIVLPEPAGSRHLKAKRTIVRRLVSMIEEGTRQGEFRRVDARTAALALLGMCNWVAWWFRPGSDVEPVVASITGFAESMLVVPSDGMSTADTIHVIDQIRTLVDQLDPARPA